MTESSGTLDAELGGGDRLVVRWTAPDATTAETPEVEVTQLTLVNVQLNSITADVRLDLRIRRGSLRRLEFRDGSETEATFISRRFTRGTHEAEVS